MASTKRAAGSQGQGAAAVKDGEYEKVPLEGGGYKRRRVGSKKWQRYCEHGTRKERCKECGGSGICEHGRQRSRCKECGGGAICEHGRIRNQCKECGGASICEHGRRRSQCKECGGSGICEHGRRRSQCKECGGASICEHGRRRNRCKVCKAPKHQGEGPGEEGAAPPPGVTSMATVVI